LDRLTNKTDTNIYANVKTLRFDEKHINPDHNFKQTEIVNLILNVHFDSINWCHVITKLRHLSLQHDKIMSPDQFCILMDNTSRLDSLALTKNMLKTLTDRWRNASVCNHLSNKIRCLKFHLNDNRSECVDKTELHYIVPIFVSKCEHLSLSIQSQIDTIALILRRMKQLRSLRVQIMETGDKTITIKWLDQQQTKFNDSNCIIVKGEQDYYFWLGKHP
jgi:hypothetical protein